MSIFFQISLVFLVGFTLIPSQRIFPNLDGINGQQVISNINGIRTGTNIVDDQEIFTDRNGIFVSNEVIDGRVSGCPSSQSWDGAFLGGFAMGRLLAPMSMADGTMMTTGQIMIMNFMNILTGSPMAPVICQPQSISTTCPQQPTTTPCPLQPATSTCPQHPTTTPRPQQLNLAPCPTQQTTTPCPPQQLTTPCPQQPNTTPCPTPPPERTAICPQGWILFEELCYKLSADDKVWDDAKTECGNENAILAEPDTITEQGFLKLLNLILVPETNCRRNYWIGGRDSNDPPLLDFRWTSRGVNVNDGVTDWFMGEPNGGPYPEYCTEMRSDFDYKWNDHPCRETNRYICQKDATFI